MFLYMVYIFMITVYLFIIIVYIFMIIVYLFMIMVYLFMIMVYIFMITRKLQNREDRKCCIMFCDTVVEMMNQSSVLHRCVN